MCFLIFKIYKKNIKILLLKRITIKRKHNLSYFIKEIKEKEKKILSFKKNVEDLEDELKPYKNDVQKEIEKEKEKYYKKLEQKYKSKIQCLTVENKHLKKRIEYRKK